MGIASQATCSYFVHNSNRLSNLLFLSPLSEKQQTEREEDIFSSRHAMVKREPEPDSEEAENAKESPALRGHL